MPYTGNFEADMILTTSCAVDLCSTGMMLEILKSLPVRVYFPYCAYRDHFPVSATSNDIQETRSLSELLDPLMETGFLSPANPETDQEWQTFFDLTANHRL